MESQHVYLFPTLNDANRFLNSLKVLTSSKGFVTVADVRNLMGLPSNYVDEQWGWLALGDLKCERVENGFALHLPAPGTIAYDVKPHKVNPKKKIIVIEADRFDGTDHERAWLDVVDEVTKLVYSSGNGWNDVINLKMRRED